MATLNPNLREFWNARKNKDGDPVRFRTLYGGRMSSKSHDAAGVAIAKANFAESRFLCLRMYQNRIADSVYALLKDKIEYFGLQRKFTVYADAIEHKFNGSLFRFYGMARNVDEIKSFERASIAWVEEAHNLTEHMFRTIRPTIMRNDDAEMWFTFNPRFATDFAYKRLVQNPPRGSIVRHINYDENPFLGETALADIEAEREEDIETFNHIYLGIPYDNDDQVIIRRAWIESAVDAHLKIDGDWSGNKTVGYDVADDGDDKNATTVMDGSICVDLDEWKGGEDELRESAARALATAKRFKADQIGYDSIGVGAATGSMFNSMKWRKHYKFNAGAKVNAPERKYGSTGIKNKDFFTGLKAQNWWMLADRFRNTHLAVTKGRRFTTGEMISISSEIDKNLRIKVSEELSTPRKNYDPSGKVMVETKKELRKREVPSPNIADSFVIANARGMLAKTALKEWS